MPFRNLPILLVDSDDRFRRTIVDYFRHHGFLIIEVASIDEADTIIRERSIDMVILDWNLPGSDGVSFCSRLRSQFPQIPIVIMTDRSDLDAQLEAYMYEVDDYWPKPYPMSLAVAKTRSILRRIKTLSTSDDPFVLGDVTIDLRKRVIIRNGEATLLGDKEYGILRALALEDGAPVRRETLLARVWGFDSLPVSRTIDNYIVALRRKIEEDPSQPQFLLTVGGIGYRLLRSDINGISHNGISLDGISHDENHS